MILVPLSKILLKVSLQDAFPVGDTEVRTTPERTIPCGVLDTLARPCRIKKVMDFKAFENLHNAFGRQERSEKRLGRPVAAGRSAIGVYAMSNTLRA